MSSLRRTQSPPVAVSAVDPELRVVLADESGFAASLAFVRDALARTPRDTPRSSPSTATRNSTLLVDLRALASAPDSRSLRAFAQALHALGLARVAVVASRDYMFGIARMLATYAQLDGLEAAAFRSEPDAARWLAEAA